MFDHNDYLIAKFSDLPSTSLTRFSGADGILVECGKGILPGGNGASWDWGGARPLTALRPFALAGGLSAATVAQAIAASGAGAVDVSSAVEQAPGVKDLGLVRAFIDAAHRAASDMDGVRVF